MIVATDPTGAVIALWQAKQHIGAGVQSEHGSIAWCELLTGDPREGYQVLRGPARSEFGDVPDVGWRRV